MDPSASPTPTPGPDPTPAIDLGGIADAIVERVLEGVKSLEVVEGLRKFLEDLQSGALAARFSLALVGVVLDFLWNAAGGALAAGANIFTQLPPAWSYDLAPVREMRAIVDPIGRGVLGLALVLAILSVALGVVTGRPFGAVLHALPRYFLAGCGLVFGAQLIRGWIDFSNLASARLLDPATGLPGLSRVQGFDRAVGMGAVSLVYVVCGVLFFLVRIKLVVLAALLVVTAPLAIAAGALPFAHGERFFRWWLSTFLAVTFVQVLQAVCLGLGAALIAQPAQGALSTEAEGLMSVAMGIGSLFAALSLPGLLLGSLGRADVGGRLLDAAFKVGMLASGVGTAAGVATIAGAATASRAASAARMATVAPAQMAGYTHSLLAERTQLLLPPPRG